MKLHIKNMVCNRCKMVVEQFLEASNFKVSNLELGYVTVSPSPSEEDLLKISQGLNALGFELIVNEKDKIIEQVKNIIIETIQNIEEVDEFPNLPTLLSDKITKDYASISRLFSEREGITLEKFIIQQKVEKIKELLQDNELNINEIAWKLGYSSSAHLSSQFKNITHLTPSAYKINSSKSRKSLDEI